MKRSAFGLAFAAILGLAIQPGAAEPSYKLLELEGHLVKWGSPHFGRAARVSYALAARATVTPGARNCGAIDPLTGLLTRSKIASSAFRAQLKSALASWEAVANIRFYEAKNPALADVLIGAQAKPRGWAFTNVDDTGTTAGRFRAINKALICLNPEKRWKIGFDGSLKAYDLRYTLMHEIGHAIGLDHPGLADEVMSFKYLERFGDLQAGDAAGAGVLYGAVGSPVIAVGHDMDGGTPVRSGERPPLSLGDSEPQPQTRPGTEK